VADRNLILKKSLDKIVSQALQRDKSLGGVETIEVTFLFRAPVRTAMCDWVYGLKIYVKEGTDTVIVGERIKERITRVMSQISNDTFCLTDINFL
jgi:hypothetical protein